MNWERLRERNSSEIVAGGIGSKRFASNKVTAVPSEDTMREKKTKDI